MKRKGGEIHPEPSSEVVEVSSEGMRKTSEEEDENFCGGARTDCDMKK